ncbi:replication initiation protein [Endozoicomonas sp.]|uniref:replication initiation protein n=1 Tax=Endozoicomonas sp. TaxID=1892382 RepID=UPI00383BCF39
MKKTYLSYFMKKDLTIVKHNHLIEASYRLNLDEQRLVLACIAKIDPRVGKDFPDEITVTAQEFSHHFGLKLTDSCELLAPKGAELPIRQLPE